MLNVLSNQDDAQHCFGPCRESSTESFTNSATSVECPEHTLVERGGSETWERRRELKSATLGMESQDNGKRLSEPKRCLLREE